MRVNLLRADGSTLPLRVYVAKDVRDSFVVGRDPTDKSDWVSEFELEMKNRRTDDSVSGPLHFQSMNACARPAHRAAEGVRV